MTGAEKAAATRERLNRARAAELEEETKVKQAARLALQRVLEHKDATPEQILQAAELLVKLKQ